LIKGFFGEYRWLSNFWYSSVEYDGLIYPTVEHAYQAAKTYSIADREIIKQANAPSDAKRLGKRVKIRDDWHLVKIDVMKDLLRKKFTLPALREKLLATGDSPLEEANTWGDTFWGTCEGLGQNKLGELLMEVRNELHN